MKLDNLDITGCSERTCGAGRDGWIHRLSAAGVGPERRCKFTSAAHVPSDRGMVIRRGCPLWRQRDAA